MRISTYIDMCQYIVRIYQRVAFVENNFLFLTKGDKKMNVNDAIRNCKSSKNREENMNGLIQKFQPIIHKYARKLYSLEYEDVVQELIIALIKAVDAIEEYENEGRSINYLIKGIMLRFYELQRKSIAEYECRVHSEQIDENALLGQEDPYVWVETKVELERFKEKSSFTEQCVIEGMILGMSDAELAEVLHVSRQYINRKRKAIIKSLKERYKSRM